MDYLTYDNGIWQICHKFDKDLGLYRAQGVVEFLEARDDIFFHLDDHYERLLKSCCAYEDLSIEKLPSKEEIAKHFKLLHRPIGAYIARILVTPGISKDSKKSLGKQTLTIDFLDFPQTQTTSFKLKTINAVRSFPQYKLTAGYGYVPIYEARIKRQGFDKFLYWSGIFGVLEGAYENIFFITRDGELLSPNVGILYGITRKIVLTIAEKSGIFTKITERSVHLYQLDYCDECFITSTTLGIAEVSFVNEHPFACSRVSLGNWRTRKLKQLFAEYRKHYYKEQGA